MLFRVGEAHWQAYVALDWLRMRVCMQINNNTYVRSSGALANVTQNC